MTVTRLNAANDSATVTPAYTINAGTASLTVNQITVAHWGKVAQIYMTLRANASIAAGTKLLTFYARDMCGNL